MSKWPKCPTCKGRNVELIEIWDAAISWMPDDPFFNEGVLTPGDPDHVEGNCLDCGHRWRLRRTVQVSKDWFESK